MPSILIEKMLERHGYPVVDTENLDDFLSRHEEVVLFFAENPKQFPESDDVAMILPELVKAFDGRFQPALVSRESEHALQQRYGFRTWPSLVFLRGEKFLGVISQVQNWDDYLRMIREILEPTAGAPRPVGIPVVSEPATAG